MGNMISCVCVCACVCEIMSSLKDWHFLCSSFYLFIFSSVHLCVPQHFEQQLVLSVQYICVALDLIVPFAEEKEMPVAGAEEADSL